METQGKDIVLYDGECGFCHFWVQFIVNRDREARYLFCPLQSTGAADELLERYGDTIVLVKADGETLVRSDAVLLVMKSIGGVWGFLASLLKVFPRFLRDTGYRLVASIRRTLFAAPNEVCPVLPQELRKRFLDALPQTHKLDLS